MNCFPFFKFLPLASHQVISQCIVEISMLRDSNLGEENLLDREEQDVLERSGNSSVSEDEVESTKESQDSDESDSDVSEDAAAYSDDRNERGKGFYSSLDQEYSINRNYKVLKS